MEFIEPKLTEPDKRPFSAGHLWRIIEAIDPDSLPLVWDFETAQMKYDASEGTDAEAYDQIVILKDLLWQKVLQQATEYFNS